MEVNGLGSPPASRSKILLFLESRFATTLPAEPAPTRKYSQISTTLVHRRIDASVLADFLIKVTTIRMLPFFEGIFTAIK